MMQFLAQSGGGIGQWLNPHLIYWVFAFFVFLFSLLGKTIKKIKDQNAKRAAELAGERRREEVLRTGRDETGAFVGVSRKPDVQFQPPPSAAPALSVGDDARRKLRQLAEERRKELAQMVRQGVQGRPGGPQRPGAQPPRRDIPPIIAPSPAPMAGPATRPPDVGRPISPGVPVFQPLRPPSEKDIRRQRDERANKKAAQQAAAKRKAQENDGVRVQPAPQPEPRRDAAQAAYAIAPVQQPFSVPKTASASRITAALDRLAALPGAPTNALSEWRRAIVLGELLREPIALRPPGEGA